MRRFLVLVWLLFANSLSAFAQELTITTVTRAPFSMVIDGVDTGFTIELWDAVAQDLGLEYSLNRVDEFGEMLGLVSSKQADAAIANISITADREEMLDFSHPIFASGLQIMSKSGRSSDVSLLRAIFSKEILTASAIAIAVLLGCGMLMWRLERNNQPYFDMPAKKAMFPAFWWALNLIVNGGFEERVPKTIFGRLFGVILVISSLFFVSIFVAKITATLTVDAIQNNVNSANDLYGKQVATIGGSTASGFLDGRDVKYQAYSNLDEMFAQFEAGNIDAVVFDGPILAYYVNNSRGQAELAGSMFQRENYGFALQSGSPLAENINQSLLRLRESGVYESIYRKWFGVNPGR